MVAAPLAVPVGKRFPHVAPEQPAPERLQVTPLFCASFCTVAVNCDVVLTSSVAEVAESCTLIAGDVIVIVAEAVLVGSATEEAVSVTLAGLGTLAGAV